jgi:hypothetical protein
LRRSEPACSAAAPASAIVLDPSGRRRFSQAR